MLDVKGKDITTIVVVICLTILLLSGKDSVIGYLLLGVLVVYYGLDLTPFIRLGRNQKPKP